MNTVRGTKLRHSDEDVKFWAQVYVELGMSLEELEKELGISHSTTWWCFIHRLPTIDYGLYEDTMKMISYHKHKGCVEELEEVSA